MAKFYSEKLFFSQQLLFCSPAMSFTPLVVGDPKMEDRDWALHIKSLAGSLPIMPGDQRKLSGGGLTTHRRYADWLQLMAKKYDIMIYRQDLKQFGEPIEGRWDGFKRINPDTKSGGIIGIFRHGAAETKRRITVDALDPLKQYNVKTMSGKLLVSLTGEKLNNIGFEIELKTLYSVELMEIETNNN